MKNWKKRMAAALLTAVMAAGVVANATPASAATLTAKQYLTKMEKASKKAKSCEITQIMSNNYTYQGQSVNAKVTYKMIKHMNPLQQKTTMTTVVKSDGADKSEKAVSYLKENKDGTITEYDPNENGAYTETDVTEYIHKSEKFSYKNCSNAKIEKKSVKVNKIDTVKISYQIKGENLRVPLLQLGVDEAQVKVLGVDLNSLKPIKGYVWIDKKTYYPVKEVIDEKDLVNSYNEQLVKLELSEETMEHSAYKYSLTYTNYNKAKSFKFPKV